MSEQQKKSENICDLREHSCIVITFEHEVKECMPAYSLTLLQFRDNTFFMQCDAKVCEGS